jgi:hypothetical protein
MSQQNEPELDLEEEGGQPQVVLDEFECGYAACRNRKPLPQDADQRFVAGYRAAQRWLRAGRPKST